MLSHSATMWTAGHRLHGAAAAEPCRQEERDMASIFHTVNKMSFAVQGKYTASHSNFSKIHTYMHCHTLITKSLQSSTWQRHTNRIFFFSPPPPPFSLLVSHKTTSMPVSKAFPFVPGCENEDTNSSKCNMRDAVNKNQPGSVSTSGNVL